MESCFFRNSFAPLPCICITKLLPAPTKQFLPTPFKAQFSVMKNLYDKKSYAYRVMSENKMLFCLTVNFTRKIFKTVS
jgi:hypothetical protein